jgi:phospholipid/cholesterol/gamma-HCH transport system substrate-binding protein
MRRYSIEMIVGIFVLIGLVCLAYMTIKLGKMEVLGGNYYTLTAAFTSVAGLKPGASVEMTGVEVGKVNEIAIDQDEQMAVVKLKIQGHILVYDDAIASIKTSGLIGDKYIKIDPGGSDEQLKNGDRITETEASIDLEELISKYVFGGV